MTYLHEPITTSAQVEKILRARKVEDEHHDWKATWWNKGSKAASEHEAAKDVAAFLNADGGTILLGIRDEDDEAAGLYEDFDLTGTRERLLDLLRRWLLPEEAVDNVDPKEIRRVKTADGKGAVLAVNIAPWAHGPVAVRFGDHREQFRVPVRRGRETREMSWRQVMERTAAGHRATYIRLQAAARSSKKNLHVVVRSPMQVRVRRRLTEFFVDADSPWCTGQTVAHGTLGEVSNDRAILNLTCHPQAAKAAAALWEEQAPEEAKAQLERLRDEFSGIRGFLGTLDMVSHLTGIQITCQTPEPIAVAVPLGLIKETWSDSDGRHDFLNVMLDGALRWENHAKRWAVVSG